MGKKYLGAVILFVFATMTFAADKIEADQQISQKIQAVLNELDENINIGIVVQDAKTGNVIYKKDADRYFMPASNQKLFTAFAALQALGPDFTYPTQLFMDYTNIHKGVLHDNLYLQFSGDPVLTINQLESLFNSLSEVGVQRIKGKIIVDDTAFDQMTMSPGTAWEDQDFCWGSPVSALTINHNCVNVTVEPAVEVGQLAKLALPNYPQSMRFINQVVTQADTVKDCVINVKRSDPTTYVLSGCIKAASGPQPIEMAIESPRNNVQLLLKYLLDKNQITNAGDIEFKKFEMASKPFARQDSPPLKALVATMLKESDNTIADALFKTIGANYAHEAGSFTNGGAAVRDILAHSMALNFPKTTIIDGAGASRYNFLKPEQIATLLQKIFLSPQASNFIDSLAISGIDGTLKDRMKEPLTVGKIHAKTGSETAVTSLSGYLETNKKRTLIFSIMINGFTEPAAKYKALEDKLCKILVESN